MERGSISRGDSEASDGVTVVFSLEWIDHFEAWWQYSLQNVKEVDDITLGGIVEPAQENLCNKSHDQTYNCYGKSRAHLELVLTVPTYDSNKSHISLA